MWPPLNSYFLGVTNSNPSSFNSKSNNSIISSVPWEDLACMLSIPASLIISKLTRAHSKLIQFIPDVAKPLIP